jgi:hypothetical protein
VVIPRTGSQIIGFADLARGSAVSYARFGIDARHFEPVGDRFILASHVALQYMSADNDIPFWALSSLGGDRSYLGREQPLRGFGAGRFVDRNVFSASLELRSKIFELNIFTTDVTFEMAPFVDTGRVFHEANENFIEGLHTVGGLGFRAFAAPFVVGYVDVGYGAQGVAVFSGINYPF